MRPNLQPAGSVPAPPGPYGATSSWTGFTLASNETPEPVSRTFGGVPLQCSLLLPLFLYRKQVAPPAKLHDTSLGYLACIPSSNLSASCRVVTQSTAKLDDTTSDDVPWL